MLSERLRDPKAASRTDRVRALLPVQPRPPRAWLSSCLRCRAQRPTHRPRTLKPFSCTDPRPCHPPSRPRAPRRPTCPDASRTPPDGTTMSASAERKGRFPRQRYWRARRTSASTSWVLRAPPRVCAREGPVAVTHFRFRWPETSGYTMDMGWWLVRTCETAGGRVFTTVVFARVDASRRRDRLVPRAAQAGPDPGGRAGRALARAGLSARSYRPPGGLRPEPSTSKMDTERAPLVIRARASPAVLRRSAGPGDGLLPKVELNCPRNRGLS